MAMEKRVEARGLSKTFSTLYRLQKLGKYSVLNYKRKSNYYEAREKYMTKSSKNVFLHRTMVILLGYAKCYGGVSNTCRILVKKKNREAHRRKLEENVKTS